MWFFFALGGGLVQVLRSSTQHVAQLVFEASLAGAIVPPRGEGGFGWDRLFQPLGQPLGKRQTLTEMPIAWKNRLSMRRLALAKMAHFLRTQGSLDAPRTPSTSTHARR